MHVSATLKPSLLTVPGEIRNEIYRMLLTTPYAYQQNTIKYAPLHPAILQTNRQIHTEAVNILHGENIWIIANITAGGWPPNSVRVPTVSKKHAGKIKHPALHINFKMPIPAATPQPHVTLIMGEESIDRFLETLWRMSTKDDTKEKFKASSLHLTLFETPYHTKSKLQSTCLQPFGLVSGLRKLKIQGQVEPACAEEILYRAESGFKNVAQVQNVSQVYLNKGDEAYFAGTLGRALSQYTYGSAFLMHVLRLRLREATVAKADIITLKAAIEVMHVHWARASLAYGCYEDAKRFGQITLKSGSLPNQARMHMRLCTARAHRALGEVHDELRLFEEALNADGDKSTVLIALAELFQNAAPEQVRLLVEQHGKLQRGEGIDFEAIRAFWETV